MASSGVDEASPARGECGSRISEDPAVKGATGRRPTVLHLITGLETGGAELMLSRLIPGLEARGVSSLVVSMTRVGAVGQELQRRGVAVEALGLARGRPDPRGLWRLQRLVNAVRPAVVQTWMYHADLLGALVRMAGARFTLAWNLRASHLEMSEYPLLSRLTRRACVALSRVPALVLANSTAGRDYHEALGYRPRRWEVLPNGIDTNRFRPDATSRGQARQELGLPGDEPPVLVGFVARVDPMKGHRVFLEAFEELVRRQQNVHALFLGEGARAETPVFARWLELKPSLGSRVHFLGRRDDVERWLPAVDVFCQASLGEGFPNAVAEAMAAGLPVVATDVGDTRVVTDALALLVPPGQGRPLADALERMVASPAHERRARGTSGRTRIVQHFSLEDVAARYAALYEQLASESADRVAG
jgi:glycosyltransferase involved in cell wall biosynthesis